MPIWAWTLIAVFGGCLAGAVWFLVMVHVGSSADSEKDGVRVMLKKSRWMTNMNGRQQFFGKGETLTGWTEGNDFCFTVQYPDGEATFKTPLDPEIFEKI